MEEEYFEQHWLFNSNPIKIGQRCRTNKEISMLKNKSLEKINSVIFKLRQHNSEYMQDLADELEEAIKEDKVNVTCYGKTETMSRKDAIQKYFNCMICSEGAEQRRYVNIYTQLKTGCTNCTDEE